MCGENGYHWMRVLTRTISNADSEEFYTVKLELDHACPPGSAASCAGGEYPPTPSGSYPPLNGSATNADLFWYYAAAGDSPPEVPFPGHDAGGWGFAEYGTGGGPDFAGDCFTNEARAIVVGSGTVTIPTVVYGGGVRGLIVSLLHREPGAPDETIDETRTGNTGDTFTFDVSTHSGANCIHWVTVHDDGQTCGGKFGIGTATWVSTEPEP